MVANYIKSYRARTALIGAAAGRSSATPYVYYITVQLCLPDPEPNTLIQVSVLILSCQQNMREDADMRGGRLSYTNGIISVGHFVL
jgi:hypothetical protein